MPCAPADDRPFDDEATVTGDPDADMPMLNAKPAARATAVPAASGKRNRMPPAERITLRISGELCADVTSSLCNHSASAWQPAESGFSHDPARPSPAAPRHA